MPSTHAIFERLVADKPALRLDTADLVARGERAAKARRRAQATGAVSAFAAGGLALAAVANAAGDHATPTTATPAAPPGFAFTSAEQIMSADARVVTAMLKRAGPSGKVTLSSPSAITNETKRTIHEVSYRLNGADVTLLENVSAPGGNPELMTTGLATGSQTSPCDVPHHPQTTQKDGAVVSYAWFVDCAGTSLPDGAVLWTMRVQWPDGTAPQASPEAIVEAADGSSVFVQTSSTANGAATPAMTRAEVGDLAVSLAQAWRG
jgi:hypothetical protein